MNTALNPEFVRDFGPKPGETIFDKSKPGRLGVVAPELDVPVTPLPSKDLLRAGILLPEVSEPTVLRHFVDLANKNFSIETGMYPLGSCTMKYNPRRHEEVVGMRGFSEVHPAQPAETMQGTLQVLFELQRDIAEIMGMSGATLNPMAGAHGELAGMLMIKAFHLSRGDVMRTKVLIPESAHGTNPATAVMSGFEVIPVKSGRDGNMDLDDFRSKLNLGVAAAMITQPSTLGLFDTKIIEVADLLHRFGALLYGDGANMNALLGKVKLGQLGFDVAHINTHKALTTPHGGGGPGAGPVAVGEKLLPFLPNPTAVLKDGMYQLQKPEKTIGRLGTWYGNVGVLLRAYSYIRTMGEEGLRAVSENAVLNANYLRALLKPHFGIEFGSDRSVMHEVVINGLRQKEHGVRTLDLVKRLIDYGFHPPTIYFPIIAHEAMMVEPTETEGKESLDAFAAAMTAIAREVEENPEVILSAPHFTPVGRLDETLAARRPVLRWRPKEENSEAVATTG